MYARSASVYDAVYSFEDYAGIESLVERHELGMFSRGQYEGAVRAAGLTPEHHPEGLIGRGLYLGRRGP